jgi:hypothetical protein
LLLSSDASNKSFKVARILAYFVAHVMCRISQTRGTVNDALNSKSVSSVPDEIIEFLFPVIPRASVSRSLDSACNRLEYEELFLEDGIKRGWFLRLVMSPPSVNRLARHGPQHLSIL